MIALVGLALIATLTACGGGEGSVGKAGSTYVLVGAEHGGDTVAGVGVGGRVTVVGGCLGIDSGVVIWPYGTKVVGDSPLVIDVPGLGHVSPGDAIQGGGEQWGPRLPQGVDALPAGCPGDDLLAYWPD